jgi:hypothetical protein
LHRRSIITGSSITLLATLDGSIGFAATPKTPPCLSGSRWNRKSDDLLVQDGCAAGNGRIATKVNTPTVAFRRRSRLHRASEHSALNVAAGRHEVIRGHGMGDALRLLLDDRPFVEVRRDVMRRRADQFDAALVRLVIASRAAGFNGFDGERTRTLSVAPARQECPRMSAACAETSRLASTSANKQSRDWLDGFRHQFLPE